MMPKDAQLRPAVLAEVANLVREADKNYASLITITTTTFC